MLIAFGLGGMASPVGAQDWIYTVRPGDNLWDITERHLKHLRFLKHLKKLNKVEDPWHILPGTRLRIPLRWVRLKPASARVVALRGEITVLQSGDSQLKAVTQGMTLHTGDKLRTGTQASATIEFGDGSIMLVEPDSEIAFDMLRAYGESGFVDTRVRLKQGRTEHQVTPRQGRGSPRYEIMTPAATSAVRGTNYRIGASDAGEISATEVLTGEVGVSGSGKQRVIPQGFGAVVRKGAPPEPAKKLLEAPELDNLPGKFDRVPIHLALPVLPGAVAYRAQIADDRDFLALRYDARLDKPRIKGIDLPDRNFVLRVRGIDASGLEGLDGYHEFSVDARPEPPILVAPPEAARISIEQPELHWAEPEGAAAYRLQVATETSFAKPLIAIADLRDNRYRFAEPLGPGVYYWRVSTRNESGEQGPFGDPQSFKRLAVAPDIQPPGIDKDKIVFRWSAALPGDRYEVQLARDKHFEQILIQATVPEPTHQISRPEPGNYYLRVRVVDAEGDAGPYGTPQRVEIPLENYWPLVIIGAFFLLITL